MLSTMLTAAGVDKPVFAPSASDSATALDVAITCPTPGAGIRYTLNGEDPTTSDPFIRSGSTIRIARTATLKARAWDGGVPSDVAEEEFRITGGIAVGNQHALALSVAGRVWSWGNQANGRLGNGASNTDEQVHPVQVSGSGPGGYFEDGLQIAGGHLHSLLLDQRGDVWAFGENYYGALGDNSTTDSSVPIQVLKSTTAGDFLGDCVGVAAGERFSLALSSTGEVFSWGYQGNGRLGNGSTAGTQRYALPVLRGDDPAYPALTGIRQIAAGATFGYAREANEMEEPGSLGKVWVWGLSLNGQLGQGNSTTQSRAVPMKLTGGADLTGAWSISGGESHTAIVRWDPNDPALLGTVWTCGNRSFGRLGQGSTSAGSVKYPDLVVKADSSPLAGIVQVASGAAHSLAVDQDGRVWAWGYNGYGQLGDGTTSNSGVAIKVKNPAGTADLENIVAVAAGGDGSQGASMALAEDGTIYVWGRNNKGQLGNGEVTNYATVLPVAHAQNHVAEFKPSVGLTYSLISDAAPGEVSLTATPAHSAPGGISNIQRVDFYFGGKWIKTLSGPPWAVTAFDLTAGDHHAYAIVHDNEGVTAMSPSISVTIDPSLSDDPDGDGLTTEFELTTSNTDPTNPDTDGDGMEDGYEQWNGFSPLSLELGTSNASYGDADGDGVTNKVEHDTGRLAKVWYETYIQEELTDDLLRLFVRKGFITSVEYSTNLTNWSVYPRAFVGHNLEEIINLNDWSAVDLSLGRGFFRLRWESVTEDQDGDGMPDLWEAIYNLDVTDDGTINPELGPDGDIDGDGLTAIEEFHYGTDPTKWDTDGDGFSDGAEVGNVPGDFLFAGGVPNSQHGALDPEMKPDAEWVVLTGDSIEVDANGEPVVDQYGEFIPTPKNRTRKVAIPAGEARLILVAIHSDEFEEEWTAKQSQYNDTIVWNISASGHDPMTDAVDVNSFQDEWLAAVSGSEPIQGYFPATIVEGKIFTAPAGAPIEVTIDLTVANVSDATLDSTVLVGLLPVEVAPEVLAVNSDFDEGRIDPATGYAIPDCDDIPDVDAKTGSGNTEIVLNAARDHLDGLFANDEKVTDDLHQGCFGVNPNLMDDDFWDGATVTIRKLDKIDDDTGYKESGQVRFYAKWNDDDYYGISPYDFDTLQPVNLVSAGVNKRPGEGVYGSTSTIPDDAEFWMEGGRPGKITLEWRLQKGDIDVSYEQTFLVATQQSKQEWIDQVYYQVKLQSTHLQQILGDSQNENAYAHPLAAFPIDLSQYDPSNGFFLPASRNYVYIQTVYYYYSQFFNQKPEELYWAGMAKTAGAAVYAGMVDMNTWKTWIFADHEALDKVLNDFMIQGNKDIFVDQSWSHHAYVSSGIWALRYLQEQQEDDETIDEPLTDYDGWNEIYQGVEDDSVELLHGGNRKLLRREQEVVMQPMYEVMKDVWLKPNVDVPLASWFAGVPAPPENADGEINIDEMFSINGRNPVDLTGPKLREVVPNGKLSNLNDRWAWIDNGQNGMLQIWLGTSTDIAGFTEVNRENLNGHGLYFWLHAALYSQLPTFGNFHVEQFPPKW